MEEEGACAELSSESKGRNLSRCKMEVPRLSGDKPARGCFILWAEK